MSKADYAAIAAILAGEIATHRHNELATRVTVNIAYSMADYFAQTNPRFDRARFYDAAQVPR